MANLVPIKPSVFGGSYPPNTVTGIQSLSFVASGSIGSATDGVGAKGDDVPNPTRQTYLVAINNTDNDSTIAIQPMGKPAGMNVAPYTVPLKKGIPVAIGPFDPAVFNDSGGNFRVAVVGSAANPNVLLIPVQVG